MWQLSLTDLLGSSIAIKFYLVEGDGYLLVENDIARESQLLNEENLFILPGKADKPLAKDIHLPTYHISENRTHLMVVPSQKRCLS